MPKDVIKDFPPYEESQKLDDEMRGGLAEAYTNKGLQKYLKSKMMKAIESTALASKTMEELAVGQRIAWTYKNLMDACRTAYEQKGK